MGAILTPTCRVRQPRYAVPVNRSNPLTQGLDVCIPCVWEPSPLGGAVLTQVGSPVLRVSEGGVGYYNSLSAANRFSELGWPSIANGQGYTYACVFRPDTIATGDQLICADNVDSSTRAFQFKIIAGEIYHIAFNTAVTTFTAQGVTVSAGKVSTAIARCTPTLASVFANGIKGATEAAITGTLQGHCGSVNPEVELGCRSFGGGTSPFYGQIIAVFRWNRALSDSEAIEVSRNPWQLLSPIPRRIFAAEAAGPATHATSGALAADAAVVAGTAARTHVHTSSGALAANAAVVAGTAARTHVHTSSGALAANAAVVAGTAARTHVHTSSGALAADAAVVAGTAARTHAHATSGALAADAAVVAGTAARTHVHTSSGALAADAAVVAGTADHSVPGATHTTSGALAAASASVSGIATLIKSHAATGALSAGVAVVAGTAERSSPGVIDHATTGALAAEAAIVAGTVARTHAHTSSGALASDAATISGIAAVIRTHVASGALVADPATVSGVVVGPPSASIDIALQAVLATCGRAYQAVAPHHTAAPYIVWEQVSSVINSHLDGLANLQNVRIQIDCYAKTAKSCKTLRDAVVSALAASSITHVVLSAEALRDEEADLHRQMFDISVWTTWP
jgi:hypothetical protein